MNSNHLAILIQESTSGSNLQYLSDSLKTNQKEVEETNKDERIVSTQISNKSDVFSFQTSKTFIIYSLVNTNLTDAFGRSGYSVIRLYSPKNTTIKNFEEVLYGIQKKYTDFSINNNLNNQDYTDILSKANTQNSETDFIVNVSKEEHYHYFGNVESLDPFLDSKALFRTKKLYAFNKELAKPETVAEQLGLKPFGKLNATSKKVEIQDEFNLLQTIKINDIEVEFNPFKNKHTILCSNEDKVYYKSRDNKEIKEIFSNSISINKVIKHEYNSTLGSEQKKTNFLEEYGLYITMVLLTVVIGILTWFFFLKDSSNPETDNTITSQPTVVDTLKTNQKQIDKKILQLVQNEEIVFIDTTYKHLAFKFDGGKWSFKNKKTNTGYVDLYNETIDEIIISHELPFQKTILITELEELKGKKIENKPLEEKPVVKTTEKKKVEETKKKKPVVSKSNKSKPTNNSSNNDDPSNQIINDMNKTPKK